jgi:AraC-like DNA-binding protein
MQNLAVGSVFRLDSEKFSQENRFEAWRAVAQEKLLPFDLQRPDGDSANFACRLESVPNIAGLSVTRFESSSIVASRSKSHLSDGNDNYQLRLMEQGEMVLEMDSPIGGRTANSPQIGSLSASILSNGRKSRGWHMKPGGASGRLMVVSIPRGLLHSVVPNPDAYMLQLLPGTVPLMRFMVRYINDLVSERLPVNAGNAQAIRDQIMDLVAILMASAGATKPFVSSTTRQALRVQSVKNHIEKHFQNSNLSLKEVADAMHLSPRSVQNALETENMNFSQYLLRVRLERAKGMLHSSSHRNLRVSEIAYECGFNDVSYFNRTFRGAYALTPRELRRDAQADVPPQSS